MCASMVLVYVSAYRCQLANVVKVTSWCLAGAELVPQKPNEVLKDAVLCECYL